MSAPFIIWTMQRTGGTSLAELLMAMSEHPAAEHEPFNWAKKNPRQFCSISEAWNTGGDSQRLRQSLEDIFEHKFLIKHCYELLNMTFNMHLISVSSCTPYRHVILRRRDEPSRLISKFIAEAQGTWFKDYSWKVFSEVVVGERQLKDLPIDRIVGHYRHSQQATKFITDTLEAMCPASHTVFFEDLYTGGRESRLEKANELFDFLEFSQDDVHKHAAVIEEKIFNSGQNTASVAKHVSNYREAMHALEAAGCSVATSMLASDTAMARPTPLQSVPVQPASLRPSAGQEAKAGLNGGPTAAREPTGPRDRIVRECVAFAEGSSARGPFLEIANIPPKRAVLSDPYFTSAERHILSKGRVDPIDGLAVQIGDPNDMRALYPDGHFGTVLWVDSLGSDKHFWRTLDEIKRVLAPGGLLIVVSASFGKAGQNGFVVTGAKGNAITDVTITQRVHTVSDYWRISPQSMRDVLLEGLNPVELRVMMVPPRIFGVATKPFGSSPQAIGARVHAANG